MANRDTSHDLVEDAIGQVDTWLRTVHQFETRRSTATMAQLRSVIVDQGGLDFVMGFIDRVARPDDPAVSAAQLHALVTNLPSLPGFLNPVDRILLRIGAHLGPKLPRLVIPLARKRMRSIVGHLVAPAEPDRLSKHLRGQQAQGWASNVNLLGEAVLGDAEAARRQQALLALLDQPAVDYVSVKLSSVAAQLNPWAWDESLEVVSERLIELVDRAALASPPTFVNLDMEEYHDLDLTIEAFEQVLGTPERRHIEAGIVLQAYLPDALGALQRLSRWAAARVEAGGAPIKVRLVKGANLAMERVDAAMHGWSQAPYETKAETDANFVRCLDWVLDEAPLAGLRIGVASHNLFHVAWAQRLASQRGVQTKVQFEMLQGMAEAHSAAVAADISPGLSPLLYTPAVDPSDFDMAIGYLFRRLEENASTDNFMRSLFDLEPDSPVFRHEAERFRNSVRDCHTPSLGPRRTQDRGGDITPAFVSGEDFANEPETDPTLPANRRWIAQLANTEPWRLAATAIVDPAGIDVLASKARRAQTNWRATEPSHRRAILHAVGDELAKRRLCLMRTMADECGKTVEQADVEICEAIDFARYYAERTMELDHDQLEFEPLGLISVVPPWNFPIAIPSGGVLSAIAAMNGVLFKPAPEAQRCGEIIHQALIAGGVPEDLVAFVLTGDGPAGRRTVEAADAVILTGSSETADLFRTWNPALRLFAETSGKNALIITPSADIDLAVDDLVASAFGHAGQKCSAASLAILVGSLADSPRLRRQLVDAVESLTVTTADDLGAAVGPLIGSPNERLTRAFAVLDDDEHWLVEPRCIDVEQNLWRPGVRAGVTPGSWFHRTECFGPVLGLMRVADLDEAIRVQNSSEFGLTGGIHTLDPEEIADWIDRVQVGNAYVNRPITGAIVQRQPFGGWKRSVVGPGAKAGGLNYVAQLGTWRSKDEHFPNDFAETWAGHFAIDHDPSGLFCESNVFRYRPLNTVVLRHGPQTTNRDLELVRMAVTVAGVRVLSSDAATESDEQLVARLDEIKPDRIRVVGATVSPELRQAANAIGVHIADQPVVHVGRRELLHYVREQAVSRTLHRFGNLTSQPPSVETGSASESR